MYALNIGNFLFVDLRLEADLSVFVLDLIRKIFLFLSDLYLRLLRPDILFIFKTGFNNFNSK